jgi:hypothetical protein
LPTGHGCVKRCDLAFGTSTRERLRLPEFAKGVKKAAKEATKSGQEEQPRMVLHQDAFAAGYHKDEYILLSLAIKYAGLHNVAVTIIGKNE